MHTEKENRQGGDSGRKGSISVVGIGPGGVAHLTVKAIEALKRADRVVGYTRYIDLILPVIPGKEVFSTGMTGEVERCRKAIEFARGGETVAVVSSGDSGIYGMAGLVLELVEAESPGLKVDVIPGVPAFAAASSILGAPLMHDFASVSLSDLLTDWTLIEERVEAAAKADFVMVLYNPKSSKRVEGLSKAVEIILRHRSKDTPVGIVKNATRDGEATVVTTLGEVGAHYSAIDMLTILIVGNSSSYVKAGRIITPRGYSLR